MSSEPSRARIDQFFASRKRKTPPLPKDGKPVTESRSPAAGSPSAKGTLSGFLSKSPHVAMLAGQWDDGRPSVTRDIVKRNLTSDVDPVYDVPRKPILDSCSRETGVFLRDTSGKEIEPADSALVVSEKDSSRAALACEKSSERNLELKSDLASTASLPSQAEPKGQKRDGSPSLVAACSKTLSKRICASGQNDKNQVVGKVSHAFPEPSTYQSDEMAVNEISGSKFCSEIEAEGMILRTCSATPTTSISKTERCGISVLPDNVVTNETPKSISRSSIFSPGEEFWSKAIEVADGFLPADTNLPEQLRFSKSSISDNKSIINGSFCRVNELNINLNGAVGAASDAGEMAFSSTLKNYEKPVQETKVPPRVGQQRDASPLPVKHFDFSHEDNLHNQATEKNETSVVSSLLATDDNNIVDTHIPNLNLQEDSHQMANCLPTNENHTTSCLYKSGDSSSVISKGKGSLPTQKDINRDEKEQNRSIADGKHEGHCTPSSHAPSKYSLHIGSWLPFEVCSIYTKKGISELYPWQVECLLVDGVLEKRNLVYCATTSSGKSFVAEILMLRQVLSSGKMALLVLPYVSLCAEKADHLEQLLEPLGKHVRSFYGNQGGGSLPKDTSVAVCTIEKANSLVNRLLEESRLSELGIIVIDELHMVADPHRGYLLELLLTKLRYAAGEGSSDVSSGETSGASSGKIDAAHSLQIVGMSATMPNVAAVAHWLQAALYQTDFRPVPLEEFIKVGNTIFNKKMNVVRMIPKRANLGGKDPDHIVELCNEVIQEGNSVLLFCSSRKGCESTARHVARFLNKFPLSTHGDCEYSNVSSAIEALRKSPGGLDPILEQTLPFGVAYHHAGLTVEEREVVETCYRRGLVRILTATSTLAAGVNLPARRVIFRQPRVGRDLIDGTRYRQMAGRAGRTGIDTKGESILICQPGELKKITAILNDSCPPLQSCLSEDKNGMTHAIMEVVSGGIVQTADDINRYVRCTLLNSTQPFQDVVKSAQESLRWLCHRKFLEWNEDTKLYSTTPLGRAAFGSSLTPEESLVVLDDLLKAREGFVLASDLHLVYLVTPINVEVEPDWELYYGRFMELSALDQVYFSKTPTAMPESIVKCVMEEQSVGNRVGVTEPFLMRMAHGALLPAQNRSKGKKNVQCKRLQSRSTEVDDTIFSNEQTLRVSKRFYVALMLSRLVQEVPVSDVCEAFKVARGMIQALQENAGRFSMMVSVFCERLGWNDLHGLVAKFQNRVSFGVRAEIAELTAIPFVKGSRARALYNAGLRTPLAIAEASVTDITKVLFDSSAWAGQDDSNLRHMQLGVAKKIKNGARKTVLDQAEEARVAAFSAFKSLGVHVPQLSRPLLSSGVEESPAVNMIHSPVGPTEDVKHAEGKISNYIALNSISSPMDNRETQTRDSCLKVTGEIISDVQPPFKGDGNEARSLIKEEMVGCVDAMIQENIKCNQRVPDGVNEESSGTKTEGPMNASNYPGGFDYFLDKWAAVNEFCFDLHFLKRLNRQSSSIYEVFGLAICWENSPIYYCNFSKDLVASSNVNTFEVWELARSRWKKVADIMRKDGVRKITWDLKNQIQALKFPSVQRFGRLNIDHMKWEDVEIIDNSFLLLPSISVHNGVDLSLTTWILWPDEESKSTPNLDKVVKKRLSNQAVATANRDGRWRNQMRKVAHNGCCRRAAQIRALGSVLLKLAASEGLSEVLMKIEYPLIDVLAAMERWGIGVDMETCLSQRHVLIKKLKELEKEAYKLAGIPFSLHASADISNVLYTHLKLPVPQGRDKGKLHPSTDKHSLDQLRGQHPIISVIKEHRTLSKLLNSTLGSICSRAQLCVKSQKYKIQGHWLQTSTATGRLSVEEPNLQCVQHMVVFTTHRTDQNGSSSSGYDHHQINARDIFIPTQDNWLLLTADYSQIELRLMAHFSKDASLIDLLSRPDGDVFMMIASRWTCKPESAINSEERDYTKRLVYGILYGMGSNALAEQLQCSPEEASDKIQSFKKSFPGVSAWLTEVIASCREKGYVETLMGRKRFLSKIKLGNSKEKAKAQRQAVNSICQGSAADIIKMAMINIHSAIVNGSSDQNLTIGLTEELLLNIRANCRMVLQVHDELMLEVDQNLIREAGILLQMSMENAVSLHVPLPVKLMFGKTWGSLEPLQLER